MMWLSYFLFLLSHTHIRFISFFLFLVHTILFCATNLVVLDTPDAREMQATISQGKLLPDEMITKLVGTELRTIKQAGGGYILDGFPRTANQAKILSEYDNVDAALDLQMR